MGRAKRKVHGWYCTEVENATRTWAGSMNCKLPTETRSLRIETQSNDTAEIRLTAIGTSSSREDVCCEGPPQAEDVDEDDEVGLEPALLEVLVVADALEELLVLRVERDSNGCI